MYKREPHLPQMSIMMESCKGGDVISRLPEDILSSILSNLTIRDATRGRVLSPRWRYISPFTSNLHLDIFTVYGVRISESEETDEYLSGFVKAVSQIMDSCKFPIDSFYLCYNLRNKHAADIDNWLRIAIGLQTKKLHLELGGTFTGKKGALYRFPGNLPNASHLNHLYLRGCALTQTVLDAIFSGCINLESLTLSYCRLPRYLSISSKQTRIRLQELVMIFCFVVDEIEISSLDIATFVYKGNFHTFLRFVDTLVTVEARLWGSRTCYSFHKLAEELPQLPMLSLLLNSRSMEPLHDNMAKFLQLKELEIKISVYPDFDLLSVAFILDACPGLEKFCLLLKEENSRHHLLPPERREISRQCYNELKEVEISSFRNRWNALDLVLYLLNSCTRLERMTINYQYKWGRGPVKCSRNTLSYGLQAEREQVQALLSDVSSNAEVLVL